MAEVKESSILIQDVETRNIMTKSTLPVGGYSVNPYVGCTHSCKQSFRAVIILCPRYYSKRRKKEDRDNGR